MSHIVEAKTTVILPHLQEFLALKRQGQEALAHHPVIALLRQAMTLVAGEHGGKIESYYYDYSRERHEVNTGLALHIPFLPGRPSEQTLSRGIGLVIDEQTGALTFVGDPYRVEAFFQEIQASVLKRYVALAYMAAMQQGQYQHIASRVQGDTLVVSGEIHA